MWASGDERGRESAGKRCKASCGKRNPETTPLLRAIGVPHEGRLPRFSLSPASSVEWAQQLERCATGRDGARVPLGLLSLDEASPA